VRNKDAVSSTRAFSLQMSTLACGISVGECSRL